MDPFLVNIIPYVLLFGFFVWIMRNSKSTTAKVIDSGQQTLEAYNKMAAAAELAAEELRKMRVLLEEQMKARAGR